MERPFSNIVWAAFLTQWRATTPFRQLRCFTILQITKYWIGGDITLILQNRFSVQCMYLILLNNWVFFSFQEAFDCQQLDCCFSLPWAVVRGQWKSWENQTALALGSEGIAVHAALNSCRSLFHKLKVFVSKARVLTIASWMGAVAIRAPLQITTFVIREGMEVVQSRSVPVGSPVFKLWAAESKQLSLGSDWQIKQTLYTWAESGIWPYGIPVTEENWRRNLAK